MEAASPEDPALLHSTNLLRQRSIGNHIRRHSSHLQCFFFPILRNPYRFLHRPHQHASIGQCSHCCKRRNRHHFLHPRRHALRFGNCQTLHLCLINRRLHPLPPKRQTNLGSHHNIQLSSFIH